MINTLSYGTGERPVVFLHGLFGQGRNFTTIAKGLVDADASLRCLLVDLPNHGRSEWTESFSYPDMAERVAQCLRDELGGVPATVVGHSMGGKVAMRLTLDHPELVERLCVVDISPVGAGGVQSQFTPLVAALRGLDLSQLHSREQADRELSEGIPDPVVRGFLIQNLRSRGIGDRAIWSWQMNLELLGDSLAAIGDWPETDALWEGPVVWVAGERSDYVRREHAPAMKALFPRVRTIRVKDAGHWVHSEQPEAFRSVLEHFLER